MWFRQTCEAKNMNEELLYQFMLRVETVILAIGVTLLTIIVIVEGKEWLRKRCSRTQTNLKDKRRLQNNT
jgi:hypothetical protein